MFLDYKNKSETPLEFLDRIREKYPDLENKKLSYAGRLDPMASGQMLVLVDSENKEQTKHFGYPKEYIATFLVGISTDTGDSLGLITDTDFKEIDEQQIKEMVYKLRNVTRQKFPWFSAKTVSGKKLFDHFKSGNLNVERPEKQVEIKEVDFIKSKTSSVEEVVSYITKSIDKVRGDFRQEDIKKDWLSLMENHPNTLQIFKVKFLVSGGTYIRGLTEEFPFPNCLLDLERTRILIPENVINQKTT